MAAEKGHEHVVISLLSAGAAIDFYIAVRYKNLIKIKIKF
jgi:hypothetical protein